MQQASPATRFTPASHSIIEPTLKEAERKTSRRFPQTAEATLQASAVKRFTARKNSLLLTAARGPQLPRGARRRFSVGLKTHPDPLMLPIRQSETYETSQAFRFGCFGGFCFVNSLSVSTILLRVSKGRGGKCSAGAPPDRSLGRTRDAISAAAPCFVPTRMGVVQMKQQISATFKTNKRLKGVGEPVTFH